MNAVEIADAVHVVVPPRWSVTVTTPSEPLITLDVVEANCDPRETPAVGALIDSAPTLSVNVAGVAAPTGTAVRMVAAAKRTPELATKTELRIIVPPFRCKSGTGRPTRFVGLGCPSVGCWVLYQTKLSWFEIHVLGLTNYVPGILCRYTELDQRGGRPIPCAPFQIFGCSQTTETRCF